MEIKLRAYDNFADTMVYSTEEDAVFTLKDGEWKVKYVREKTLVNEGIEIDAPVWQDADDVEIMLGFELNGKEFYAGDILRTIVNGVIFYEVVRFGEFQFSPDSESFVQEHVGFYREPFINPIGDCINEFEKVGNIHQHPELLK